MDTWREWARRVAVLLALAGTAGSVAAHGGSLGGAARESLRVPTWLVVGAGGAAVLVSLLGARSATDRALVAGLHATRRAVPVPGRDVLRACAGLAGVLALAGVVVTGLVGPADPLSNPAVLVVWAGWWAGFAMSTYLVGNAWPAVNPWRALARALPDLGRTYRWRWGAWPGVAGLLALVWLEVVSPLAARPPALAVTVLAYSAVTLAGATVYGTETWFERVDPVSRVFRCFGRVAPVGTDGDRLELRYPGGALARDAVADRGEAAFVVALLWVTTFDGLVTTPAWSAFARTLVRAGVPPAVLYLAAPVAGGALYWGGYLLAAWLARRTTPTYVASGTLVRRFAPPLLAIAAASHLAHYLAYFISLVPALVLAVTAPLATVDPVILVVPDWFGAVAVGAVLAGHVLAVLAARAVAFEVFPGRLQAVRSQSPFVVLVAGYTMVSLLVVTRPDVAPPFLPS